MRTQVVSVLIIVFLLGACATRLERSRKAGVKKRIAEQGHEESKNNPPSVCRDKQMLAICVKRYFKQEESGVKAWRCSKEIKSCIQHSGVDSIGRVENEKEAQQLQLKVAAKMIYDLSIVIRDQEKIIAQKEVDPEIKWGFAAKACAFAGMNDYWKERFLKAKLPRDKVKKLHRIADKYLSAKCEWLVQKYH